MPFFDRDPKKGTIILTTTHISPSIPTHYYGLGFRVYTCVKDVRSHERVVAGLVHEPSKDSGTSLMSAASCFNVR